MASLGLRERVPGTYVTVVPKAQARCYFFCTSKAVVWILDGRGACGKHHNDLARLPE